MEPLPKERSDLIELTCSVAMRLPQWSRSRRSGATIKRHANLTCQHLASMEPLPKERSDGRTAAEAMYDSGPQWSRSRRSGATRPVGTQNRVSGVVGPQWSRSRRSGATGSLARTLSGRRRLNGAAPEGAERRRPPRPPDGNRRTAGLNGAAPEGAERRIQVSSSSAQWSCLNGAAPEGAERLEGAREDVRAAAASMEPLPKERSDCAFPESRSRAVVRPQWSRSRRSGATAPSPSPGPGPWSGLNGAAPEGAERLRLPRVQVPGRGPASMEPLPKERSDGHLVMLDGDPGVGPQWSRSRRSGATS